MVGASATFPGRAVRVPPAAAGKSGTVVTASRAGLAWYIKNKSGLPSTCPDPAEPIQGQTVGESGNHAKSGPGPPAGWSSQQAP